MPVRVASRRGEIVLRAQVSEKTSAGIVFIPFHFAEAAANLLTNDVLDPQAKIPEFKACAVQVFPARLEDLEQPEAQDNARTLLTSPFLPVLSSISAALSPTSLFTNPASGGSETFKLLSTPHDPAQAVLQGLEIIRQTPRVECASSTARLWRPTP